MQKLYHLGPLMTGTGFARSAFGMPFASMQDLDRAGGGSGGPGEVSFETFFILVGFIKTYLYPHSDLELT